MEVFEDGVYTVWAENIRNLEVGDKIYLTTSNLEYDCMCGCFMNGIRGSRTVQVKILFEDLSEYDPRRCNDGGCYGFATAEVLKILDDEECSHSDFQSKLTGV